MSAQVLIFIIMVAFGIAEAVRSTLLKKEGEQPDDLKVELISSTILFVVTQPAVLFAAYFVMSKLFPGAQDSLIALPIVAQILLLIIGDDMIQYWWHRASHTFPFLYNLHRSHHNAGYMSVRIVARNNIFYYALMPNLWITGALIYLGLGWVYAFYLVVKMTVIIGAHSDARWDAKLYQIKWLSPLMWIVERTISTPATHSAHHGKHKTDGITHYKGNYGNMLFFWDVLFGTAKITRQYPPQFGVEELPDVSLGEQLAWPVIKTKRAPIDQSA